MASSGWMAEGVSWAAIVLDTNMRWYDASRDEYSGDFQHRHAGLDPASSGWMAGAVS